VAGDTSLARQEVDQTLRLPQDEVEREIASLRLIIVTVMNSGTAGLLEAGGAAIAFAWVVARTSGFHLLLITTVVLLLSCGYVSWSASKRARRNLERFARL
jgi:hypothetical protein